MQGSATPVGIAVVAVVAVALAASSAAWALHRRSRDDQHSVSGYQRTLETLQAIGTRSSTRPPAAAQQPEQRPSPSRGTGLLVPSLAARAAPPSRRPRRSIALAIVAVVVVAAAIAVVVGTRGPTHHPATADAGSAKAVSHAATGSGSTGSRSDGSHATGSGSTGSHAGDRPASSVTTLPAHYAPESFTSTTATYLPPAASYSLTVAATSGPCWIAVTDGEGATVLSGTLAPGSSKTVTITGPSNVVIGATSAGAVSIDGAPVLLPAGALAPFAMSIVPAGSSAPG